MSEKKIDLSDVEHRCSSDFANNYDCAPGEYHRALGFHQGFTAGQKTLSPEVREALEEAKEILSFNTNNNIVTVRKIKKLLEAGQ
jgi:hypothetical protein